MGKGDEKKRRRACILLPLGKSFVILGIRKEKVNLPIGSKSSLPSPEFFTFFVPLVSSEPFSEQGFFYSLCQGVD